MQIFNQCLVFLFLFICFLDFSDAYKLGNLTCGEDPRPVPGSKLTCSYLGCKLECSGEYRFPKGEKIVTLECLNMRNWGVRNYKNKIPECTPTCSPDCINGGTCIDINECSCTNEYSGNYCEKKIKPCPEPIPLPGNSMGKCIVSGIQSCNITCVDGYKFEDGSTTSRIVCQNGEWSMKPKYFEKCEPTCEKKCENGGTCHGPNVCQCTPEYKGDLCQYTADQCSPKKLLFNGLYTCKGYYDKLECELECPGDFLPIGEFASKYTCMYKDGLFKPSKVPKCNYRGMNIQITHAE